MSGWCSSSHSSHLFTVPPNSQYYETALEIRAARELWRIPTYFGWQTAYCLGVSTLPKVRQKNGTVPPQYMICFGAVEVSAMVDRYIEVALDRRCASCKFVETEVALWWGNSQGN
jgi:hypothetical protein